MDTSKTNYQSLYKLQDLAILALREVLSGFYLTDGTALGRGYLNHRYSEDLDFFINADPDYLSKVERIHRKLKTSFHLQDELTLQAELYTKFYIMDEVQLKIEVVNDVPERWGSSNTFMGIGIDNPANILSNKLGCIISRSEPKDVFDIVSLAEAYSFNWRDVYASTITKQIVNEIDIAMRLETFPIQWLNSVPWQMGSIDLLKIEKKIAIITEDFVMARENTLGIGKIPITQARVCCG